MQLMESILVHDSQTIFFSDVGFVKHEANFCLTTIPEKSNGDVFLGRGGGNKKKYPFEEHFTHSWAKKLF